MQAGFVHHVGVGVDVRRASFSSETKTGTVTDCYNFLVVAGCRNDVDYCYYCCVIQHVKRSAQEGAGIRLAAVLILMVL